MIFSKLWRWREKRGLNLITYDKLTQMNNLLEEITELGRAITMDQEIDAFADIVIFSINAIEMAGYDAEMVMNEVIKELESRDGKIIEGKFCKESTLYKARLGGCKR